MESILTLFQIVSVSYQHQGCISEYEEIGANCHFSIQQTDCLWTILWVFSEEKITQL